MNATEAHISVVDPERYSKVLDGLVANVVFHSSLTKSLIKTEKLIDTIALGVPIKTA